ncbi:MAG TPA: hypothetical protein VMY37_37885 [Thermoguttaceae bacterium]|nr:hypothetical protein [Thermoguttaceae bacterium]
MDWERQERAWPFVSVLACLLTLLVTWPRSWQQVAPFRAAAPPDRKAADLSPTTAGLPDEQARSDDALPRLAAAQTPPPAWAEAVSKAPQGPSLGSAVQHVSELQLAKPSGKLASCPIRLAWPELTLAHVLLPTDGAMLYAEAGWWSTDVAEDEAPPGQIEPSIERLPSFEVASPEGALWADDVVPKLDDLVAECRRHASRSAWDGPWPEPVALWDRLEDVAWECETGPWARHVLREVRRLGSIAPQGHDREVHSILEALDERARAAESLAAQLDDYALAAKLRQAEHALTRRLALWSQVQEAGGLRSRVNDPAEVDPGPLSLCLARIDKIGGDPERLGEWKEYLELDALGRLLAEPSAADLPTRRALARRTLRRMTRPRLSVEQREFLASKPLVELGSELRRHAAGPIDLGDVLRHVEAYESTGAPADARRVAEDCLLLGLSQEVSRRELARRLGMHYRDANVRLVLTEELLERMMPEREPEHQWVSERVMGTPVRGRSTTSADVGVRMVPDPSRLRVALQIEGLVSALTESTAGPATFWSDSRSTYLALKEIELGTWGLRMQPAEVRVDNDIRIRSLSTTLDVIPLIGTVAQEVAQSQHQKNQPQMSREVERKVAAQAKQQIDEEVETSLGDVNETLEARVFGPLAALSLGPEMLDSETTESRLSMRLRLAADEQLAGHTCRPWAPSDSLASCQIHESALNNVIQQIGLDGGTFTPAEVRQRIAEVFNSPEILERDPGREDVEITFAAQDAVRVRCRDGRVAITLSIAKLRKSPSLWTDFQVRAFYRPEFEGLRAELVRDGIVKLDAVKSLRSQIPLRGVFSKTFSKQQPWKLTPERLVDDPRMADLAVTQLVIEDGWIGVALGPKRVDSQPVVAQRNTEGVD